MKRILAVMLTLALVLSACGKASTGARKDAKRAAELHAKPVLWQTIILIPEPDMPDLKTLIPMEDAFDPNIYQAFSGETRKTPDYIPESVMAFAWAEYEGKPRFVSIKIGDIVDVVDVATNNMSMPVYLVRTVEKTYAWLYAYHIQDPSGKRIMALKDAKPKKR